MDTIRIDILNPKAKKLLEDLEALELIAIKKDEKVDFQKVIERLRKKSESTPSLEEIAKEVAVVRTSTQRL
ncbi:hypothetical protein [Tunicatimonas pelagia]|uniref:hypothetical protein n=1 Tax=Tunicatimonas pelagia TaxID=931531 RepID=UPI0026670B2F|nr:hypothetical protein [Tunicatimonas pelagia]WKN41172.1 hypothetical protein P0M28_19235 [Tunicatimonas pelagia]